MKTKWRDETIKGTGGKVRRHQWNLDTGKTESTNKRYKTKRNESTRTFSCNHSRDAPFVVDGSSLTSPKSISLPKNIFSKGKVKMKSYSKGNYLKREGGRERKSTPQTEGECVM